MATLLDIKTAAAHYLDRGVADLTVNTQDLGLIALNQARNYAELQNDFEFSRKLVELEVNGVTGGALSSATLYSTGTTSATVTGTLSPNLVGTYVQVGTYNGFPFYLLAGTTAYALWNNGSAWYLAAAAGVNGTTAPVGDRFTLASTSLSPAGTYTAAGSATGAPVVAVTAPTVDIKTVIEVGLFDDFGNFRPIEWTTVSESLERQRKDNPYSTPRYPTDAWAQIGPAGESRFAFSGDTLYRFPFDEDNNFTVGMEVYSFTADWVAGDLSTTIAPWTTKGQEYLLWATIFRLNHLFKAFVPRQEGNLPPPTGVMEAALEAFKSWDTFKFEQFRRHSR